MSDETRKSVLKFCTKKSWKLLTQDTGASEPNFQELKDFILIEAYNVQKTIVYDKERAVRDGKLDFSNNPEIPAISSKFSAKFSFKFDKFSSFRSSWIPGSTCRTYPPIFQTFIVNRVSNERIWHNSEYIEYQFSTPNIGRGFSSNRTPRCIYCDSLDHRKGDCKLLTEDLRLQRVKLNEKGYIVNVATGEEIPPMYGRGGMKCIIDLSQPKAPPSTPTSVSADTNVIVFDDSAAYGSLGGSSIRVTTFDDDGVKFEEVIDADVEMKRKKDDVDKTRRVRAKLDSFQSQPESSFLKCTATCHYRRCHGSRHARSIPS